METNHQQTSSPYQGSMFPVHHASGVIPSAASIPSNVQDAEQYFLLLDVHGIERLYNCTGSSSTAVRDVTDGAGEERKRVVYQRIKWTEEMVKILITAVSYIKDNVLTSTDLIKKGKWRAISLVLAERGYCASPQQCEDKFNDLNKRYKRLHEILGRGIACHVVEDPEFMELMDLTDEAKEEARKILGCKQLFYQEMCSYNNQNRLFLPHDPALQQTVLLALKGKGKCSAETLTQGMSIKRTRPEEHDILGLNRASGYLCYSITSYPNLQSTNLVNVSNSGQGASLQNKQILSRILQLTENKLQIQEQILELEKQLFESLNYHRQEERVLAKMRLENEAMKLANERLALELRRNEVGHPP